MGRPNFSDTSYGFSKNSVPFDDVEGEEVGYFVVSFF